MNKTIFFLLLITNINIFAIDPLLQIILSNNRATTKTNPVKRLGIMLESMSNQEQITTQCNKTSNNDNITPQNLISNDNTAMLSIISLSSSENSEGPEKHEGLKQKSKL